jgi:hypothetical protein
LSAALVLGCAPSKPPPASAPPAGTGAHACIAPVVRDQFGHPVSEASASITGGPLGVTNSDGYAYLAPVANGVRELSIEKDGFEPYRGSYTVAALDCDTPVTLVRRPPPAAALPRLVPDGQFFRLSTGARFSAIEASDFALYARFLDGGDIESILRQRASAGFNMLRVWTRMQLAQFGIGSLTLADDPDLYERLPRFLQRCADHGFYVELTAYTGREDYDPQHWNRLVEAVRGQTNVLLELVNENDQAGNHIDLAPFTRPMGVLASHGSNGSQARPVEPFWDYADFHTNGASEEQRKIGHNGWEIWKGPTITNETSRFPDVGMWRRGKDTESMWLDRVRRLAFDSAAGAALLSAGSAFHSVHGKSSEP